MADSEERGSTLVELLVASLVGLLVVLAAVQLLQAHVRLARRVQSELGARGAGAWAMSRVLEDIERAGADPRQSDLEVFATAEPDALVLQQDVDADGVVDPASAEWVGLRIGGVSGRSLVRRVGRQAMSVVAGVVPRGFVLRYFDGDGQPLPHRPLDAEERRRIRRVEVTIEVADERGMGSTAARLRGASAVQILRGRP